MAKRNKLPAYSHERSTYKGIAERLALVSHVSTVTTEVPPRTYTSIAPPLGKYSHTVRLISKTEGWQVVTMWTDNNRKVSKQRLHTHNIATAIEGARAAWYQCVLKSAWCHPTRRF